MPETKPPWRALIQKLSDKTGEDAVILNARADRFLYYYYKRRDDRLPRRKAIRVHNHARPLAAYVDAAAVQEFYVIGQPSARAYDEPRGRPRQAFEDLAPGRRGARALPPDPVARAGTAVPGYFFQYASCSLSAYFSAICSARSTRSCV